MKNITRSKIFKSKKRTKKHMKKNTKKYKKRTPRHKYKKTSKRLRFFGEDDTECPICLENLEEGDTFTTNCQPVSHKFHLDCIEKACSGKAVCVCPLCRTELNPNPNRDPIQEEIDEHEIDEETLVTYLINARLGNNYTITPHSTPDQVYDAMVIVLGLWNDIATTEFQTGQMQHISEARRIIRGIYDRIARARPENYNVSNDLPVIRGLSSVILRRFHGYVEDIEGESYDDNEIIDIPAYDEFNEDEIDEDN